MDSRSVRHVWPFRKAGERDGKRLPTNLIHAAIGLDIGPIHIRRIIRCRKEGHFRHFFRLSHPPGREPFAERVANGLNNAGTIPALVIRISRRPYVSRMTSNADFRDVRSLTSPTTAVAGPLICARALSAFPWDRARITTVAPCAANSCAAARPIPLVPACNECNFIGQFLSHRFPLTFSSNNPSLFHKTPAGPGRTARTPQAFPGGGPGRRVPSGGVSCPLGKIVVSVSKRKK